jgi:hypothetical protein
MDWAERLVMRAMSVMVAVLCACIMALMIAGTIAILTGRA